jgi:hypothetical protein
MSMLSHILKQDALIISTTIDRHGDQKSSGTSSVKCRFRYITEVDRQNHAEGIEANDAIVWFEPDENITEGSIIQVDDKFWRINRLIKARQMSGNAVQFLKGFVKRYELSGNLS